MHREAHYWHSDRLGREMGVVVHGHYGSPMIAFPTTGGDEWEY
jgi:esterase/lipase superfamily enzyme